MVDKAVYIMGLNQALEATQEGFIPLEYNVLIVHPLFTGGSKMTPIVVNTDVNWTAAQIEVAKRNEAKAECLRQTPEDQTWANNDVYQMNVRRG